MLVFEDGTLSVRLTIGIDEGWSGNRDQLLAWFGSEGRDGTCTTIRARLEPVLTALVAQLTEEPPTRATLPYFHLVYIGQAPVASPAGAVVDGPLRSLLYPMSHETIRSASPDRDVFVFPGFAFSLIATGTAVSDPEQRVDRYVRLFQLAQQLYRRVARTCDEIQVRLNRGEASPSSLSELLRWESKLQGAVHSFLTPTFSFDHDVLVVRDRLLETWRLDRLLDRVGFLTERLRLVQTGRRDERDKRRQHQLQLLVVFVAVLSTVQIVEASLSLYDRFLCEPSEPVPVEAPPEGSTTSSPPALWHEVTRLLVDDA